MAVVIEIDHGSPTTGYQVVPFGVSARIAMTVIALAVFAPSRVEAEGNYRLGIQDRIRVHVYDWPQLTGEFTVDASGKISLPLLGEIAAANSELPQLGRIISERLKIKAGMVDPPDTSVSIIEYRPFYVLGWVQRPGEYPFRPGMMTISAISVAGGFYRAPVESGWTVLRDAISGYGDAKVLELKRAELTARETRLRAEMEGKDFDPSNSTGPHIIVDQEVALFAARRTGRDDEIDALARRNALYLQELETLDGQRKAVAKDRALVETELKRIRGLVERGLTTAAQSVVLERSLAQIERETLDIDTQVLRARQQISIGEQTIGTLGNDYRTDAAAALATVQAELREIDPRQEEALRMVSASRSKIAAEAENDDIDPLNGIHFEITRNDADGHPRQIEATLTTVFQPGDILDVRNTGPALGSTQSPASFSAITPGDRTGHLR